MLRKSSIPFVIRRIFVMLHLSIDLYSHFTICPTTQDGMTKRYGKVLVFPQTVQRINHTLA